MTTTAREIMRTGVHVVAPELSLTQLERTFIEKSVSGFPVVSEGQLVGIVSRSDVVRAFCVERTLSETATYLYKVYTDEEADVEKEAEEVADRVADRLEHLNVRDVMVTNVICVSPGDSVTEVARVLVSRDVHRVPVTEDGRLLGIISTLDLTRLIADGKARVE